MLVREVCGKIVWFCTLLTGGVEEYILLHLSWLAPGAGECKKRFLVCPVSIFE